MGGTGERSRRNDEISGCDRRKDHGPNIGRGCDRRKDHGWRPSVGRGCDRRKDHELFLRKTTLVVCL